MAKPPGLILFIIVFSQFCCTSLWFAGNGVMTDLIEQFRLPMGALGHLTSSVQFGFICGTLIFAILTIADRFSPSRVFFACAAVGGLFNLGMIWEGNTLFPLLVFRFLTGFSLAGIYPVGMKIAADYFDKGLGRSLGFLVGALVIGTAFPHFLKGWNAYFSWKSVLWATSYIAWTGGVLVWLLVPNGPYRRKSQHLNFSALFSVFKNRSFRAAAFGYFGHMWELYAFWAFVPVILKTYGQLQGWQADIGWNISDFSFWIIALGSIACIGGGIASQWLGEGRLAAFFLLSSGLCCLLSPWMIGYASPSVFIGFLILWSLMVIGDSPLFSTLVARNAAAQTKGTALTIVNCIGFSITIISIQILTALYQAIDSRYIYLLLSLGPILGLFGLLINKAEKTV